MRPQKTYCDQYARARERGLRQVWMGWAENLCSRVLCGEVSASLDKQAVGLQVTGSMA